MNGRKSFSYKSNTHVFNINQVMHLVNIFFFKSSFQGIIVMFNTQVPPSSNTYLFYKLRGY